MRRLAERLCRRFAASPCAFWFLFLTKERAFAPKYFPFRHSVVKHQQTAKSFFKQKNEKFF